MFFYIVGVLSVSFMKTLQTTEIRPPTWKHRDMLLEVVQERECEEKWC